MITLGSNSITSNYDNMCVDSPPPYSFEETLRYNRLLKSIQLDAKIQRWKFIFLMCNCLLMFTAMAVSAAAIFFRWQWMHYEPFLDSFTDVLPFVIMVGFAAIMCGLTLMGYITAFKSYFMVTIMYGLTLISTMQLQIYMTVVSIFKLNTAKVAVGSLFRQGMEEYGIKTYTTAKIDKIQEKLNCCGAYEIEDWFETPFNGIPASCCPLRLSSDSPTCKMIDLMNISFHSCVRILQMIPEDTLLILFAFSGVIIFIEIVTLICTCKLGKLYRQRSNELP